MWIDPMIKSSGGAWVSSRSVFSKAQGASPSSMPSRRVIRSPTAALASANSLASASQGYEARGVVSPHSTGSTWSVKHSSSSPAAMAASAIAVMDLPASGEILEWVW